MAMDQLDCLILSKYKIISSTLHVGLSRLPHRANTNLFHCNSLASKYFCPKFETKKLQIIPSIPLIDFFLVAIATSEIFAL